MTSGIYKITNNFNNKLYVGCSSGIEGRIKRHKEQLFSKSHFNTHLQRAWNKYGSHNFSFDIVQVCPVNEIYFWEDYWVKVLKLNDQEFGYNVAITDPKGGSRHNEETKRKIGFQSKERYHNNPEIGLKLKEGLRKKGAWNKGKPMSEDRKKEFLSPEVREKARKARCKPVLQYDMDGNFVQEWESINAASKFFGQNNNSCIHNCISKGYKQSLGYKWKYKKITNN